MRQRRAVDFYDVKADVESMLARDRSREEFRFEPASHPALHPGQTARILRGDGEPVGWIGESAPGARA